MKEKRGFKFVLHNKCPVCKSFSFKYLGMRGGKYQRWGLGVETKIVQCENCSVIFPNPFPVPEKLDSIHENPEEYFSNTKHWKDRSKSHEYLVKEFIKKIDKKGKIKILDVGAGRGEFCAACSRFKNVEIIGLEITQWCIDFAKKRGVTLLDKTLEDLITEDYTFDGICLNAVIEHVHNPNEFIRNVSSLLNKGGVIYIDCPREPNLLTILGNLSEKILFRENIYNLQPTWEPFHVFGYNPKALEILLNNNNIAIIRLIIEKRTKGSYVFVRSSSNIKDKIKSFIATQINKFGNFIGLGTNMYAWCKKNKN